MILCSSSLWGDAFIPRRFKQEHHSIARFFFMLFCIIDHWCDIQAPNLTPKLVGFNYYVSLHMHA